MKRVYQLSFVLLYLMSIVSCSDETQSESTSSSQRVDVESETIIFSPGDSSRVSDYQIESLSSRSGDDAICEPQLPDDAISMEGYNPNEDLEVVPRVLYQGVSMSTSLSLKDGCDYYIYGSLNITSFSESGGTIYIMETGVVTIEDPQFKRGVTMVNYGSLYLPEDMVISDGAYLSSYTPLSSTSGVTVSGYLYCGDTATFDYLTIDNRSGEVYIENDLRITGDVTLNNGSLYVGKYLKCSMLTIANYASLTFGASSLIECNIMDVSTSRGQIENLGDSYAVISCENLVIRESDQTQFGGWIDIHAYIIVAYVDGEVTWLSSVIFDGSTYIAETDYNPSFGTPSEQQYGLKHIAQIAPHESGISATSIDVKDSYAYVSWHTAESELNGYIDVIDISSLEIVSTLYASDRDFNHIYIGDGEIYTAGDNNKGAFIAEIDYPNSLGEVEIYQRQVDGASGNSLLVKDDNIWVVSGSDGGVSIIDQEDEVLLYNPLQYAKYITSDGDNILVLAGYPVAKLYCYDESGEFLSSYSVGGFYPNDGKNTVAKYGDVTYVALGNVGLKAFENGVNTMSFGEDEGSANCVAVDEDYVYLANGVNGFVVLDRADFSVVARHMLGDSSANFVAVGCDGRLYVAYGQHGVNIYELVDL